MHLIIEVGDLKGLKSFKLNFNNSARTRRPHPIPDILYRYDLSSNSLQKNNAILALAVRIPSAKWSTTCRYVPAYRVTLARRFLGAVTNANPTTIAVRHRCVNSTSAFPRAVPALARRLQSVTFATIGRHVHVQR